MGQCFGRTPTRYRADGDPGPPTDMSPMQNRLMTILQRKKAEVLAGEGKHVTSLDKICLSFGKMNAAFTKCHRIFDPVASDSGHIDFSNFNSVLPRCGITVSESDATMYFNEADTHGRRELHFRDFLVLLAVVLTIEEDEEASGAEPSVHVEGLGPAMRAPPTTRSSRRARTPSVFVDGFGVQLRDTFHLCVDAYLLFDKDGKGYITQKGVGKMIQEHGSAEGASTLLSEDRWNEMDYDSDGRITFEEFLYALFGWIGVDDEDLEDGAA